MEPKEKVLVVERKKLFGENTELCFDGFKRADEIELLDKIKQHGTFMERDKAEEDPDHVQIIAWILVKKNDKIFAVQKLPATGDKREVGLYSLAVGGHINPIDDGEEDTLLAGARREFNEEVAYSKDFTGKLVGFINNESNTFNKVHLGAVFLQEVDEDIDVMEEEKHIMRGELMNKERLKEVYPKFGLWSQYLIDTIETFL